MIISQMDNDTFETTYFSDYTDTDTYIDKTISGLNVIGVYNYIKDDYSIIYLLGMNQIFMINIISVEN
jgi:hypothetical protein